MHLLLKWHQSNSEKYPGQKSPACASFLVKVQIWFASSSFGKCCAKTDTTIMFLRLQQQNPSQPQWKTHSHALSCGEQRDNLPARSGSCADTWITFQQLSDFALPSVGVIQWFQTHPYHFYNSEHCTLFRWLLQWVPTMFKKKEKKSVVVFTVKFRFDPSRFQPVLIPPAAFPFSPIPACILFFWKSCNEARLKLLLTYILC